MPATQSNAASVDQVAGEATAISSQSQELKSLVHNLRILVDGESHMTN